MGHLTQAILFLNTASALMVIFLSRFDSDSYISSQKFMNSRIAFIACEVFDRER